MSTSSSSWPNGNVSVFHPSKSMPTCSRLACVTARAIWTIARSSRRFAAARFERGHIMSDGEVRYLREGQIATVIFDRPAARNAMTWRMYEQLGEACARIGRDDAVRVAVLRGAGGKAFIAGTDIAQFQAFRSADDGIAYEAKMEVTLGGVEALPVPTLAVVEGFAIGGGLA